MQNHDCKLELKKVDLRVTPARLGVLAALEKTNTPMDVSALIDYLSNHKIKADRVTIFRIINLLLDKGLVKPIQFNDGKMRYEHADKADHHHFICENCSTIEDISGCSIGILEKSIQKQKGIIIKHHSLEFFGLCRRCR